MVNLASWRSKIWDIIPSRMREHLQNNFVQRCIAGTTLTLVTIWAIWAPANIFPLYLWLFILLAVREWQRMTEPGNWQQSVHYQYSLILLIAIVQGLLGTSAALILLVVLPFLMWMVAANINLNRPLWFACSVIYLTLPPLSLIHIHQSYTIGAAAVTFFFGVVWATDTAAYVIGKRIGGSLLAPDVSPKKTWSGFIGGLIAGTLAGVLLGLILETHHFAETIVISFMLSAAAQASDLLESAMKRFYDVKDTGGLIPGHGGILDRIDSLMLSAPLFALIQLIAGRPLPW